MRPGGIGYAPHWTEVEPYPGAPRFFARIVDLSQSFIASIGESGELENVSRPYGSIPQPLEIVGFAARSTFPEDAPVERRAWSNGYFMGWCFSRIDHLGEYGSIPIVECREINEAELVNALKAFGHKL